MSLATVLLAMTSYKTYLTYLNKRDAEALLNVARDASTSQTEDKAESSGQLVGANAGDVELTGETQEQHGKEYINLSSTPTLESIDLSPEQLSQQIAFLEHDSNQYPLKKIGALALLLVVMILLTFMKGGKGVKSLVGIECTDTEYPILVAVQFLWLLGFSTYFGLTAVREREERDMVQYPYEERDVVWSRSNTAMYAQMAFGAGIVAGLIGIGGGMVLGPMMLQMGVDPRVSSAVTASMVVLTSSSVAIMYVTTGYITYEYFALFFCVCFAGAYVGKMKIDAYVKKYDMASMLVLILAIIIGLSVIGCATTLFMQLDDKSWCLDGFKAICD